MKATGEDYLYVDSLPPLVAYKGETLRYQISCKTNNNSVLYELNEGPNGMEVTRGGKLTWQPKRGEQTGFRSVVVLITGDKGDEAFHTFDILVAPDVSRRKR